MFQPHRPEFDESVPEGLVETIVADFQIWAMRIPEPEKAAEFEAMRAFLRSRERVRLLDMRSYACAETEPPFSVVDISGEDHPMLADFRTLYLHEFCKDGTAENAAGFKGSRTVTDGEVPYQYWMWGLVPAGSDRLAGLASFFSVPHCGFGGYVALGTALRGQGHFRRFLRLIERHLVGANPRISGWYVECEPDSTEAAVFTHCGFTEVPMTYLQPRLVSDTSGVSDGYRLALLYKPLGRNYGRPSLTVEELKRDVREFIRVVYRLDAESALACILRNSWPCAEDGDVFASAG
jgi:hypothetical protein